jgi:hypothetical protein
MSLHASHRLLLAAVMAVLGCSSNTTIVVASDGGSGGSDSSTPTPGDDGGRDAGASQEAATTSCKGTATACASVAACGTHVGCQATAGTCSGTPTACGAIGGELPCDQQDGCGWDVNAFLCLGTAKPCDGRTQDRCTPPYQGANTGCTWTPGPCNGVPAPCSGFTNATQCAAQQGCSWR